MADNERDAGLEDELEAFEPQRNLPFPITIDANNYPCREWGTVESARFVEKRYDRGFNGGMGAFLDSQAVRPGQIYTCVNLDPTTFPYIRMRPSERDQTAITLTGGNMARPAYGFVAEDGGNVEYLYILNNDRAFKIDLGVNGTGTPALEGNTTQFVAGVAGRPVRFEGAWRTAWGPGVAAQTLTTVGSGAGSQDVWTAFTASTDDTAFHFAVTMDENVAKLWKAFATNQIAATAAVADAFAGSDEVGDSSYSITDLLSVEGRLFVSRPDRPWWFDSQRNSAPALEFVGATGDTLTNFSGLDGAMCGAHGPYVYWVHTSGLWRIFADSATPIDPFSQRDWSGIALDGLVPSYNTNWLSAAAWGRWIYATNAFDGIYVGWIENDGTVTWMGNILSANGTAQSATMRCGITTTSTNPILWVADGASLPRLLIIDLQTDGSVRKISTNGAANTDRGGDNEQGQMWWPSTDFGEPDKQKQLRLMWFVLENNSYANVDVEARVHRDRAFSSEQVGGAVTSADGDGRFELSWTPGTNDTCYQVMPSIRFDTNQAGVFDPDPADLRVASAGIRAVTPSIYRALIPLSHEAMRGDSKGIKDALIALRNLKSGASVNVREPEFNTTFTGYIQDVREQVTTSERGDVQYALEVFIARWVL